MVLHADSEDWLDWANAKADLCLRSVHKSFHWFCHAAAHILDEVPSLWCALLHYTPGIYAEGYIVFVRPFICSLVCTSVLFVELLQGFTCNQQNDLCAQRRLCTQWVAKSARFFMLTAKTDETGQIPRLICIFLLRMSFVGFVVPLPTYWVKFLVYDVIFFILP